MPTLIDDIRRQEDRYQLPTYAKLPISIEKGEGCYVYDEAGEKYLDLYGGHAVVSTGHCHPRVVESIQRQASDLIFYSNVSYNSMRAKAVAEILKWAGEPYYQVFLANSGSEVNENAIKLARGSTGRREIISLCGSFHGRTYGSLSATGIPEYLAYLNTPVPEHRILPAEQVASAVSQKTAGVLVEPIQSMGGMREIPQQILTDIRRACDQSGALLIFDEVQTGAGRTGRFLYSGLHGIYADLVSLAKGIASGFPAGALLITQPIAATVKCGHLGTTFGGGPLACAAIQATLEVFADEDLPCNAQSMGDYLRSRLEPLPFISEILGRGLLMGLRFKNLTARQVQQALFGRKILTGTSMDPHVLRLMPPLIISRKEIDDFLEALQHASSHQAER